MKFVLLALAALVLLLIAVLLIRTLRFRPKAGVKLQDNAEEFDGDKAVSNLQEMLKCKTVSYRDAALEDEAEFQKFIDLLPRLFPMVHENCVRTVLADRGLLYHWKGKSAAAPSVMMAHYDVVPVDEDGWEKPAFEGILEDGVLWGRGSLDTKITLSSALFAAEHLMAQGFVPENDIYFAFSGNEEINGMGAVHIVNYFKEQGITPALVLDEGGAVVEGVFPGVTAPCGMIGIAEKGMMDVSYHTKSAGGHASAPKPHTPVGVLSKACCNVENHPFPLHLTKPVAAMFDTLGRHSNFLYRMIFSNLWLFKGVLDMLCRKQGGELNALMRTTVAFTQMRGSVASNVIPPDAEMVSNIRLNPMDTMEGGLEYLRKTVKDPAVEITMLRGINPSPVSEVNCPAWEKVASSVASTWRGCIVSPYLMVQCSDSRHYAGLSDHVYRFSAMDLTSEERATIHGHNERIRVETIHHAAEFYIRLMKQC